MSRRSNKQSNVVPISLAAELDELMSSESIKPNIAFLGLEVETPAVKASDVAVSTSAVADVPNQPRLVPRTDPKPFHSEADQDERSSSASRAVTGLDRGSGRTAPDADAATHDVTPPGAIKAPGADVRPAFLASTDATPSGDLRSTGADIWTPGFTSGLYPSDPAWSENHKASGAGIEEEEIERTATGAVMGTQNHAPSLSSNPSKQLQGRPTKIHKCSKAQDGHSHIEEVLYGVLRRAGRPEEGPSGNVITQAGSSFLCRETRVHKRNLGSVLRRLVFKQTIEVLDYERSTTRTARRYRVFSYGEILKRRREAGLEWVVRRRGVEFVNPATGEPLYVDSGAVDGPDSPPDAVKPPTPAVTTRDSDALTSGDSGADRPLASSAVTASPLGKEAREVLKGKDLENKKSTSSLDLSLVSNALQKYWQTDDAAVEQLVRSCAAVRPDCTAQEIVHFIEEKGYILGKNLRAFTNPMGFLLVSVPKCFEGRSFEQWREREKLAEEHRKAEERRKNEEHQENLRWMKEYCRKTLDNPNANEVERRRAKEYLETIPTMEDEG